MCVMVLPALVENQPYWLKSPPAPARIKKFILHRHGLKRPYISRHARCGAGTVTYRTEALCRKQSIDQPPRLGNIFCFFRVLNP